MRISWKTLEQAAGLLGWKIERTKGSSLAAISGPGYYEDQQYPKDRILLHLLTALHCSSLKPEEIREGMEWRPTVFKAQGLMLFEYSHEDFDGSLAAIMSRIWPNSILTTES